MEYGMEIPFQNGSSILARPRISQYKRCPISGVHPIPSGVNLVRVSFKGVRLRMEYGMEISFRNGNSILANPETSMDASDFWPNLGIPGILNRRIRAFQAFKLDGSDLWPNPGIPEESGHSGHSCRRRTAFNLDGSDF